MGTKTEERLKIAWRIERLPSSKYLFGICAVLLLAYLFEAVDNGAVGYYMPYFAKEFHLNSAALGYVGAISNVGVMLGAIISGLLCDKIGRVKIIAFAMFFWGVSGLLLAYSPNLAVLLVARVMIGFGVGAEVPAILSILSELLPSKLRGLYFSMCLAFMPLGACVAGLLSYYFIPAIGWRGVAIMEAVPALVGILVLKFVPESPAWLETKGRYEEADAIMTKIEQGSEKSLGKPLPPVQIPANAGAVAAGQKRGFKELFKKENLKTTIMITIWWPCAMAAVYGLMTWFSQILVAKGFTVSKSIGYVSLMYLCGVIGVPFVRAAVDKLGRKKTAVIIGICTAVLAYFYGIAVSVPMLFTFGILYNIFSYATGMVNNLYTPELFPVGIRGTGTGYASSIGRVGAIVGPIVIGYLMQGYGVQSVFYFAIAMNLIWVIAIAILGTETKNKVFTN